MTETTSLESANQTPSVTDTQAESPRLKRGLRNLHRAWIGVIALALLLAAFLPEVVAAGWHLVYGDTVRYAEWNITVPAGWFAVTHGEGLAVQRMRRFSVWKAPPVALFLPVHVGPEYRFVFEVWHSEQTKLLAQKGYRLAGGQGTQVAGSQGYCWEFLHTSDSSKSWITCIIPGERLSADFMGDRAHIPAFYSLVRGVTRISPRP